MTLCGNQQPSEVLSLVDSLTEPWIKLPLAAMREVGPAVQTLGGLLEVTSTETFREVSNLARCARLPVATFRKHLITLSEAGWVEKKGRAKTPSGRLRRTATITLTNKTRSNVKLYSVLPCWACGDVIDGRPKLSWGAKAVLSLVMSRLMRFSAASEDETFGGDAGDVVECLEKMGGVERFEMSLRWIEEQTGLTRETIARAKLELDRARLICLDDRSGTGGTEKRHILAPNFNARIVVTPTGENRYRLNIEEVADEF